jgi:hypothetical protein
MYKVIACFIFVLAFSKVNAQYKADSTRGFISAGINPSYLLFGGYGAKVFYNFPKKWSIGLALEGSFKLPEFAATQLFTNGKSITVDWDYAVGLESRYHFNKKDNDIKGFYILGTIGYEGWTITKAKNAAVIPNTNQEEKFTNWYSSIGSGYNLFPFKKAGFWIGAQYNVIFIMNNTNSRNINGVATNIRPVVAPTLAPNLYVGWRF